jgi:hypothetical protein
MYVIIILYVLYAPPYEERAFFFRKGYTRYYTYHLRTVIAAIKMADPKSDWRKNSKIPGSVLCK